MKKHVSLCSGLNRSVPLHRGSGHLQNISNLQGKVKYRNGSSRSQFRSCTVPKIISVTAGAVASEYIGILCTHTGSGTRYTVHRCICSNGCRLCFNAIFRLFLGQCGNCEKEDSVLKCMKHV